MSKPILILYATTTGNAQICADAIADAARQRGYEPRVWDVDGYDVKGLTKEPLVIFSVSTYGDGEPPDQAMDFWADVQKLAPDALSHLRYGMYAIGDSSYAEFCGFGRKLEAELQARGATAVAERCENDLDYDAGLAAWSETLFTALAQQESSALAS